MADEQTQPAEGAPKTGPIKVRAYMIQDPDSGGWVIFGESSSTDENNKKKIHSNFWEPQMEDAHAILEFEVPRLAPVVIPVIKVKL